MGEIPVERDAGGMNQRFTKPTLMSVVRHSSASFYSGLGKKLCSNIGHQSFEGT